MQNQIPPLDVAVSFSNAVWTVQPHMWASQAFIFWIFSTLFIHWLEDQNEQYLNQRGQIRLDLDDGLHSNSYSKTWSKQGQGKRVRLFPLSKSRVSSTNSPRNIISCRPTAYSSIFLPFLTKHLPLSPKPTWNAVQMWRRERDCLLGYRSGGLGVHTERECWNDIKVCLDAIKYNLM